MLDDYLKKLQGYDPDPKPFNEDAINEKVLTGLNKLFTLMGMRPKRKNQSESSKKNFMKNYFKTS